MAEPPIQEEASKGDLDLSLVVPTRNEAANITPLLARIHDAVGNLAYEVIVVDDSDDDTPKAVERERAAGRPVRLIHRTDSDRSGGLSSAVVLGFATARGRVLVCLDADLQHPPEKVPELLAAISDADLVVASRYVPGGSPGGLDGMVRRIGSVGAKLLGQVVVPKARQCTDPLGGFFALRRQALDSVELRPVGYKILLEVLARGHIRRIVEVPYCFQPRGAGQSKADLQQMKLYLKHLVRLRRSAGER